MGVVDTDAADATAAAAVEAATTNLITRADAGSAASTLTAGVCARQSFTRADLLSELK